LIDLKISFFLIPIGIWTLLLRSTGKVRQAVRAWHLDLIIGALGRGPDFEILIAVVGLFRLLLLGLISLLLLLHFSLNLFFLLLSKSVVSTDTLAFEKRLNVNTTYIFVHGTDLTSAHDFLQLFFSQIYYDVFGF
jgi:hypothetical protein